MENRRYEFKGFILSLIFHVKALGGLNPLQKFLTQFQQARQVPSLWNDKQQFFANAKPPPQSLQPRVRAEHPSWEQASSNLQHKLVEAVRGTAALVEAKRSRSCGWFCWTYRPTPRRETGPQAANPISCGVGGGSEAHVGTHRKPIENFSQIIVAECEDQRKRADEDEEACITSYS
ncbi:TPA: hypothetical protein N0F65_011038 [Lagenidium giganteum]|uniref:Uncharacterized protein n=1 Tax=Lagenidium giganteum TaxID=4803 RepID=A0AAV2ZLF0_9STRA|nr:TPA: hypothetical protein N0F65_011038 [Lagenidium giganteum]